MGARRRDRRECRRRPIIGVALLLPALLPAVGCARPLGPEVLTITSDRYVDAFDAALESSRREGMMPLLRDRRQGVIETEPEIAGSLLEPWRQDNASLGETLENTLSFQRRRARFEFTLAGYRPPLPDASEGELGPDLIAQEAPPLDLTLSDGDLELRVWVYVERAYQPGQRPSTWTRRKSTQAWVYATEPQVQRLPRIYWTPVSRDQPTERRLLAAVRRRLDASTD